MTPFEMKTFLTAADQCKARGFTKDESVATASNFPGRVDDVLNFLVYFGWLNRGKQHAWRISLTNRGRDVFALMRRYFAREN